MKNPAPRFSSVLLLLGSLLTVPASAFAGLGDCGQPSTSGDSPKTTDALAILKTAVGQATACDAQPCLCDVNAAGGVTASDALRTLKVAVGQDVALLCDCNVDPTSCTSASLTVLAGSEADEGFTGLAHNSPLEAGWSIEMDILRRCSSNQAVCGSSNDCPASDLCVPTCDCVGDNTCELVSAGSNKHCVTNLASCASNADCPSGVACVEMAGPPQALSSGGTPVCNVSVFTTPLTGTADLSSGALVLSADLKRRTHLGFTLSQPCPRCGEPSPDLKPGDQATCSGGQLHGSACTVDAVSETFGGTSFDCPPELSSGINGSVHTVRLREITTSTTTRTAQLPCANFSFKSNPLNAPTNPGKCLDNNTQCSSNADCRRCTGDPATVCEEETDCAGKGQCAEAPDQPVTCGFWCQCGFCDNNPSLPCFQTSDCDPGQQCVAGTGTTTAQNAPQQKPNDCSGDKFLCGTDEEEKCALTTQGKCSLQSYRNCTSDTACFNNNAGTCLIEKRPCFGPRITRSGQPSPLGKYCAFEDKACAGNVDCLGEGDFCAADTSRPTTVALACLPGSSSSAVNSAGGYTGPSATTLNHRLVIHRGE